jgi:YgiT-type zinc finger domain-containing protein
MDCIQEKEKVNKMRCVECGVDETVAGTTSIIYTREGSKLQVLVSGIPADVCPNCDEAYLSEDIAQEIFELVDGILELGKNIKEGTLPLPQIEINFQPTKRVAA